jgi:hypothetical protein
MRVPLLAMVAILSCVSARAEEYVSIYGTVATLITDTSLGFAMVDARVPITSRITASAALAHLDPSGPREEQQVRLSLTAALPVATFSFDDRLLWARSDTDVEHWRNRWRMYLPMGIQFGNARWMVFDELYYSEPRGLFRNIVAAGVSLSPVPRVTSDVLYMNIDNRPGDVDHGLLVMLSVRFD